MRLTTPDGARLELAYCTNVRPAESPAALQQDIAGFWSDVRALVGARRLGLGLWFPRDVAAALARDADGLARLADALESAQLTAATVNAFPADAFHADVVKEAVYRPNWLTPARAQYTLDAARVLGALSPEGAVRTLSSLPLGFPKWSPTELQRAAGRLVGLALDLDRLRIDTGRTLRIALEPEPCCALERSDEAVAFFRDHLIPAAEVAGRAAEVGADAGREAVLRHVGVCLDLCHAAVEHEDPVTALASYDAAGVPVFKVQVSAALDVTDPAEQATALRAFAEPRWLHQVGLPDGRVLLDLPDALRDEDLLRQAPWRVHFHVPLHRETVGGLPTTRGEVERFLRYAATLEAPPLLELETYTWSVVPGAREDGADEDLAANVAAEIGFCRDVLTGAGCVEDGT